MVRISVVIAVYNGQEHIAETIDSILKQTLPPIEIIVVNDGSTDGTLAVLQPYLDRITVVDSVNHGVEFARNLGASRATGDWIAFCDHDDVWLPEKLEKQARLILAAPDIHYVLCDYAEWKDGVVGSRSHLSFAPPEFWTPEILPEGWIVREPIAGKLTMFQPTITSVSLVRRDYFLHCGGFDGSVRGNPAEDTCFHFRCLAQVPFGVIPEVLMLYRRRSGSLSADELRQLRSGIAIWEHIIDTYPEAAPFRDDLRRGLETMRKEIRISTAYRRHQNVKRVLRSILDSSPE